MPLANAWRFEHPLHTDHVGIPVFGVAHPGANGTRASGGPRVTTPRWRALGEFFRAILTYRICSARRPDNAIPSVTVATDSAHSTVSDKSNAGIKPEIGALKSSACYDDQTLAPPSSPKDRLSTPKWLPCPQNCLLS
jgi:hypothetical protein